ncbi:MAG: hypothetical protein K0B15_10630 [Lentimicrobium sp.]|nr:hypothetical protein [Lentimicrobium sp.]
MGSSYTQDLASFEGNQHYLKLVDVNLDSIIGNTAYISSTRVFGLNLIAGLYLPFEPGEDWIWGTLGQASGVPPVGKCNGTMVGISDASDQLQWKLNHPVVSPEPYVFVNLEYRFADGFNFDDRLYLGWDYPSHNCLSSDTLNHYLLQSHLIINDPAEGLRPAGKEFSHVEITDDILLSMYPKYFHYYKIFYGNKILVQKEE